MPAPMNEPLDPYLNSFVNYERYKYFPKKVNLDDYRDFLKRIGDPQHRLAPCVLIAGTNGKGSTAMILTTVLRHSGYRVGTFSSPHLFSFRERICIDGKPIRKQEFNRCIRELKPVLDEPYQRARRTFFEVLTTAAFVHFRNEGTDVNIVEVGLGGRKDATNVVTPLISVISRIGFDHTDTLGRTLRRIAREKCGIIKKGGTVVSSHQHRHAMETIREVARGLKARLYTVDRHSTAKPVRFDEYGIRFLLGNEEFQVPLRGHFQWENLCTALLVADLLGERGFPIPKEKLREGLTHCQMKGRLDIVARDPFTVLDGAHNPSAIRALMRTVRKLFPDKKPVVIFSCLSSKDKKTMARTIVRYAESVILTRIKSERATSLSELLKTFGKGTASCGTIKEALDHARRYARKDSLILVTGSIYLVADAYRALA
jgi:dihydrofolate synthase/folylpolyglutamate synthase